MTAGTGPTVFDALAADYDRDFSARLPARVLRERVRSCVARYLQPGASILDVGCGTGEDAVHFARLGHDVLATDVSQRMLDRVATKRDAETSEVAGRIGLATFDASRDEGQLGERAFDLVLSNFGALNCVADLAPFFAGLRRHLRPGGIAVLVVMGRFCPFESLAFALHGDFRKAARRWRGRAIFRIDDAQQLVTYHGPAAIRHAAGRGFTVERLESVGVVLPTTEFFTAVETRPRVLSVLAAADRRLSRLPLFRRIGDHFMLVLRRGPGGMA